jgi:DNA repair exonuclease SbcCD ATPase subunit
MDSLKPDAEDVDLFKERAGANKGGKRPSGIETPAQVSSGAHIENTSSFTLFSWILLILLLFTLGFAGYTYYQQTAKILALQVDLKSDRNFIRQSKLLMARLEGRLTETGSAVQQTGTEFGKKVAFLDSEVRKLWGVSWDRNKKAIAANEASIMAEKKARTQSVTDILTSQKHSNELLSNTQKQIKKLSQSLAQIQSKETIIQQSMSLQGEKLAQLEAGIKSLSTKLNKLVADTQPLISGGIGKALGQQVKDNAQNINAINAFRLQINTRLLSLSAQLSTLQEQILNMPEGNKSSKSAVKRLGSNSEKAKASGAPGDRIKRSSVP